MNINRKKTKHGMSYSKEYRAWQGIKDRCIRGKRKDADSYINKGIKMCDSWISSFPQFFLDMGPIPERGFQIDRINNNDGYYKENCRWVSPSVNCSNRNPPKRKQNLLQSVSYHKKQNSMVCHIRIGGKSYYLGSYNNELDAHNEYRKVFKEWHGRYPNESERYNKIINGEMKPFEKVIIRNCQKNYN